VGKEKNNWKFQYGWFKTDAQEVAYCIALMFVVMVLFAIRVFISFISPDSFWFGLLLILGCMGAASAPLGFLGACALGLFGLFKRDD